MEKQVEKFKDKIHGVKDEIFDVSYAIVKLFNNVKSLFSEKEKRVVDLKVVRDNHKTV